MENTLSYRGFEFLQNGCTDFTERLPSLSSSQLQMCRNIFCFLSNNFPFTAPEEVCNLSLYLPACAEGNTVKVCPRAAKKSLCLRVHPPIFHLDEIMLEKLLFYAAAADPHISKMITFPFVSKSELYTPSYFFVEKAMEAFSIDLPMAIFIMKGKYLHHLPLIPIEFFSDELSKGPRRSLLSKSVERFASDTTLGLPSVLPSIYVSFPLPGGKGGFGALLKKGRKSRRKTNLNIDSCRDLSGRRLRHAKIVERMKDWLEKKKGKDSIVAALGADDDTFQQKERFSTSASLHQDFVRESEKRASKIGQYVEEGQNLRKKEMKIKNEGKNSGRGKKFVAKQLYLHNDFLRESEDEESLGTSEFRLRSDDLNDSEEETERKAKKNISFPRKRMDGELAELAKTDSDLSGEDRHDDSTVSFAFLKPKAEIADDDAKSMIGNDDSSLESAKLESIGTNASDKRDYAKKAGNLDISKFKTAKELEDLIHPEVIKEKLRLLGWKCGGRPSERAERLFLLKTGSKGGVPESVWAKKKKDTSPTPASKF